jgi:hypothetical protein
MRRSGGQSWTGPIAVVGAWLIGALVFFFAQWTSGFNRIMGNTGDARLSVYLNEQWYLVLKGTQPWRNPPFFYPAKGILGYTDTFFLWQVFFAPFRGLGADPFLAFQLTIVAMSLLAFSCFVVFVRIVFRPPLFVAVIGAFVFTFANNLAQHAGSPQMFGIYFVPPIALIGLWSWRLRVIRPVMSAALGTCVGVLYALFLFSTYYTAWFTLLAAGIVAVLAFLFAPKESSNRCVDGLRTGWRSILGGIIGFGIGIVPFLLTFLPVVSQLGTRHYKRAMSFAPKWTDIVNVGTGNLLWGHLFQHLWSVPATGTYEVSYAVTPLLLLAVIVGGGAILWAVVMHRTRLTPMLRLTLALCCTSVLLTALPIDTIAGSLWVIVWHVPGATAIRAIDRIQVTNDLVSSLALVALVSEADRHWARLRHSAGLRTVGIVLLCLMALEQVHDTDGTMLQRNVQTAALASVPAPPQGCTSFFVIDSSPNSLKFYEYQIEAMLISQRIGLPTINGYSGDLPPGWRLLYPAAPSYMVTLRQWVRAHGLDTGVCQLDLGTKTWDSHPSL